VSAPSTLPYYLPGFGPGSYIYDTLGRHDVGLIQAQPGTGHGQPSGGGTPSVVTPNPIPTVPGAVSGGTPASSTPATTPFDTLAGLYAGLLNGNGQGTQNQQPYAIVSPQAAGVATPGGLNPSVLGVIIVLAAAFLAYRWWHKHHGKK
jgi:hypothetical protein